VIVEGALPSACAVTLLCPQSAISGLATASPPDGKIGSTLPVMENVDQSALARSCHSLRGVIPSTGADNEFPIQQFRLGLGLKRDIMRYENSFDHH